MKLMSNATAAAAQAFSRSPRSSQPRLNSAAACARAVWVKIGANSSPRPMGELA
jgi:hypothetical protein